MGVQQIETGTWLAELSGCQGSQCGPYRYRRICVRGCWFSHSTYWAMWLQVNRPLQTKGDQGRQEDVGIDDQAHQALSAVSLARRSARTSLTASSAMR